MRRGALTRGTLVSKERARHGQRRRQTAECRPKREARARRLGDTVDSEDGDSGTVPKVSDKERLTQHQQGNDMIWTGWLGGVRPEDRQRGHKSGEEALSGKQTLRR